MLLAESFLVRSGIYLLYILPNTPQILIKTIYVTNFIAMLKYCVALYIARGQFCIYFSYLFKFTVHVSYTCTTLGKRIGHCEIKLPYYSDIYKCKISTDWRYLSIGPR